MIELIQQIPDTLSDFSPVIIPVIGLLLTKGKSIWKWIEDKLFNKPKESVSVKDSPNAMINSTIYHNNFFFLSGNDPGKQAEEIQQILLQQQQLSNERKTLPKPKRKRKK